NPETYIPHGFAEHLCDTGEAVLNYATAGSPENPPLLLIPGQTESWWGYEKAMPLLAEHFEVFAVDLRGQGRSSRTPGRYSWDNFGNDLVRFIQLAIGRPTYVSGLSSGGVLSAWLSAYAMPGQVLGAVYEDPPLFASETNPAVGQSIRQGIGAYFALMSKYLGDQWSVGSYQAMRSAAATELPPHLAMMVRPPGENGEPPQNLKEYDPEWARAFWSGTAGVNCDHARMLASVKCPVLLTHHFRLVNEDGWLIGALSDVQAQRALSLIRATGQPVSYQSFPQMGHSMHGQDPGLYARTVIEWVKGTEP
ncbi:MAG TPA: alpha/beta hydrolase, partial [Tepidiformaceae bacterium]|nr:alpha/beta hydrolase [Tepidiformaceae bacterium]